MKSSTIKTEYSVAFRVAEQYLIRAESRAHQGKVAEAIDDINLIRARAGLAVLNPVDPTMGQDAVLAIIEKERRIELFAEWGHRWLDMKRTDRAGELLAPIKPGWQDTDQLFPIPQRDIGSNPNLLPQNPGY